MKEILMTNVYGTTSGITLEGFALSIALAIVMGAAIANVYYRTSKTASKGFVVTLALFPPVIAVILLMISGNFGAGLAVGGAFALFRIRSVSASAKEIVALLISVGFGIACGSGFLLIAAAFAIVILAVFYFYSRADVWRNKSEFGSKRILSVQFPEKDDRREEFEAFFGPKAAVFYMMEAKKIRNKSDGESVKYTYKVVFKGVEQRDSFLEELFKTDYYYSIQVDSKKKRSL